MTILITGSCGAVASALLTPCTNGASPCGPPPEPGQVSLREDVPVVTCDLTDPATCPAHSTGSPRSFPTRHRPTSTPSSSRPSSTSCSCRPHRCSTPTPKHDRLVKSHLDVEKALAAAPIESTFLRPGSFAGNALAWSRAIKSAGAVNLP
jgi:hypothetical protein